MFIVVRRPALPTTPLILASLPFLLLALAVTCGAPEPESPSEWMLDDGRTLATWIAGKSSAAVLVMNPDECMQCKTILASWLKQRARHGGQFFLFLTREPAHTQARTLAIAGIREDGIIHPRGPLADDTPVEMAFRGGRLVYTAIHVSGPQSPLLSRLQKETLEQFVAAPPGANQESVAYP